MSNPRLADDVQASELDGELVLFAASTSRMLRLNGIAGLIALHCDGEHSAAEIVDRLAGLLPEADPDVLSRDVERTLDGLRRERVLG